MVTFCPTMSRQLRLPRKSWGAAPSFCTNSVAQNLTLSMRYWQKGPELRASLRLPI